MNALGKKIETLQKVLDKRISNLNSGGCMLFAYYFSEQLKELKVDHSICIVHDEPVYVTYSSFTPPAHVMVYIPSIGYIDGYHTYQRATEKDIYSRYYHRTVKMSVKKLRKLSSTGSWNWMYDRNQNRLLKSLIKKTMNG